VDWGALAGRVFTARTLAWAGGVATVLGIVLLFVMAASRGWVTPSMRVGIGVVVSIALLAAALELDRRSWRADAILAAAGAGIAGLYASLWASTWLYHLISGTAASPLAALIAAVAVAVAIRIHQEPLAVFGVSGAMVSASRCRPAQSPSIFRHASALFRATTNSSSSPSESVKRRTSSLTRSRPLPMRSAVTILLIREGGIVSVWPSIPWNTSTSSRQERSPGIR